MIDHANNDTIQIYLAQCSLTDNIKSRYMTVYMVNVAGNCWCRGQVSWLGGGAELELPAGQLAAAVDKVQAEQRTLLRLKILKTFKNI